MSLLFENTCWEKLYSTISRSKTPESMRVSVDIESKVVDALPVNLCACIPQLVSFSAVLKLRHVDSVIFDAPCSSLIYLTLDTDLSISHLEIGEGAFNGMPSLSYLSLSMATFSSNLYLRPGSIQENAFLQSVILRSETIQMDPNSIKSCPRLTKLSMSLSYGEFGNNALSNVDASISLLLFRSMIPGSNEYS